jgi:prenyltransferase beta subunit
VAGLLNLLVDTLYQSRAADFVASCQTWEGGFGAEPLAEAHGGYTFCAIAALQLLKRANAADLDAAAGYVARRQMTMEGGFSGRSNKLVDGCYSFWQGGALAIVSALLLQNGADKSTEETTNDPWLTKVDDTSSGPNSLLFDQAMLERYILLCAQDVHGGLRDKPSTARDFYHSCYNLSGLSVAQHCDTTELYGHPSLSSVRRTHPCYNISIDHADYVLKHFSSKQDT